MKNGDYLSVASYNVHRCIGADRRMDPARIVKVIRELNTPIVGLQEVSSRTGGDPTLSHLHYMATQLGMQPVPGPTVFRGDSQYGNVLLTRLPVDQIVRHDLTVEGKEPRGSLEAIVDVEGKKLRVIVTHLGLGRAERKRQVTQLLKTVTSEMPTVLLGDINEWIPIRSCLDHLNDCFGRVKGLRTFPARLPLLALDRIWALPAQLLVNVVVHRSPTAKMASDHLPIRATLRL